MKIIFIWIDYMRGIKDKLIVMNNEYKVTKEDNYVFKVEKNNNFKSIYSSERIIDSYLMLGKNGKGKTTITDLLLKLKCDCYYKKYFMLVESNNNNYYLYHDGYDGDKEPIEEKVKIMNSIKEENLYTTIISDCTEHNLNTCVIKVFRLYDAINKHNELGFDTTKRSYDSLCFGYRYMESLSSNFSYPNALDKLESLKINRDIIFSENKSNYIYLKLPLDYSPVIMRLEKEPLELTCDYLIKLFFL